MGIEKQIEMQMQMAPQLHARVWCGASVRVHGWGCSLATTAFSIARRTWRLGAARVSYLSADEKSRAVVNASQFA